jgi:diaminohydroxyphosphoribosylaminopyrimidine deaminase/5-amino-6-(5-phosphoribosylamino)uracil reductase
MGETPISSTSQVLNSDAETVIISSRNAEDLIEFANQRGFNQLLIESGPTFGTALLGQGLIDEIVLFQAPTFLGSGTPSIGDLGITNLSGRLDFEISDVEILGADLKITLMKSPIATEGGR